MIRTTFSVVLFLTLAAMACCAQDSMGEYSKAIKAYEAHDYATSCSRLTNVHGATNNFHKLPPELVTAAQNSGRSVMSLTQTAMQAENSHEAAKACSDRYLQALLLAINDQWAQVEKALLAAEEARERMIEQMDPSQRAPKAKPDQPTGPADSSLAAIVAASKGVNSGQTAGCASEDMLRTSEKLNSACVSHLLMLARKQRSAGQKTMAKLNYQRASEVTSYMGAKQNAVVKREATKAIREIEAEQARER